METYSQAEEEEPGRGFSPREGIWSMETQTAVDNTTATVVFQSP